MTVVGEDELCPLRQVRDEKPWVVRDNDDVDSRPGPAVPNLAADDRLSRQPCHSAGPDVPSAEVPVPALHRCAATSSATPVSTSARTASLAGLSGM